MDYKYNIRGWLKEINDVNLLAKDPNKKDLFAFRIQYDDPVDDTPQIFGDESTPLFNGNISETYWRSSSDQILRKYSYQYDHLNRLSAAIYQKPEQAVNVTHSYDEELLYDKNGNITSLQRNGHMDDPLYALAIDDLQFTYTQKSNLLVAVSDATNSNQGFKDGNTTLDDYTYDPFGNLITDKNKSIINITYNHLNLPTLITFDNGDKINYFYDANGKKVAKVVNGTKRTDYCQGFQYVNNILKFFAHAEGYVNAIHREGNYAFDYAYHYTDHLGNVRLTYGLDKRANELKILEENHYYPFGLRHTNYNTTRRNFVREESQTRIEALQSPPVYKYKYNGKEWQDELGLNFYDYGARNYDPAVGRWMNIDPLAETSRRWSPYTYCYNNPLRFFDPDGMQATEAFYPPTKGSSLFKTHNIVNNVNWLDKDGSWTYNAKTETWVGFGESKGNNISAVNSVQEVNVGVELSLKIGGLSVSVGEEIAVGNTSNGFNGASRFGGKFSFDLRKALSLDAWTDAKGEMKVSSGVKVSNEPTLKSGFKTETSAYSKSEVSIFGSGGEIKVSAPINGRNVTTYSAGVKIGAKPSVSANTTVGTETKSQGTALATDRNDGGY